MKTALDKLMESLEAGTWRAGEAAQAKPRSSSNKLARSPLIEARIEYADSDPAGDAVRALLKPGGYIDERGAIRKV